MYTVGDAHCQMSLVWDGREDEDLSHVCSEGCSVTHVPSGDGGGEEDLWDERIGGSSVRHIPSGGWDRRGDSQLCLQWGMLSDTCPKWEMREERRISAMYTVGDAHCQMSLVWDGRGDEDLWHVGSGGCSVGKI